MYAYIIKLIPLDEIWTTHYKTHIINIIFMYQYFTLYYQVIKLFTNTFKASFQLSLVEEDLRSTLHIISGMNRHWSRTTDIL